jgi:flagellar motor protein MotB
LVGLSPIEVIEIADKDLLVTETGVTAFAPGSAVINSGLIPTLQTIASVVKTYGKTTIAVIGHPHKTGTQEGRQGGAGDSSADFAMTIFRLRVDSEA